MKEEGLNEKIGFLRPLWWLIHFIGITVVYILGHILGG